MNEPRPSRIPFLAALVVGVLAVMLRLAFAIDHAPVPEHRLSPGGGHAPGADAAMPTSASIGTRPEALVCFGCHSYDRYRFGKKLTPDGGAKTDARKPRKDVEVFRHDDHREKVGHCHLCHAFEGHFEVTIRRKICEECH